MSTEEAETDRSGLVQGRLTDDSIALMRQRIGFPNPSLRAALDTGPWNTRCSADAVRQWSYCIGDNNRLYVDEVYAMASRWGGVVAPPGFEMSMGVMRPPVMSEEFAKATQKALRGVQLFNSGTEHFYHRPIHAGTKLFKSEWVAKVEEKQSRFANRSVIVTNEHCLWDEADQVTVTGSKWFVHAERRAVSDAPARQPDASSVYSDEELAEIEALYDGEYVRGADTLYLEDVSVGQKLPTMVKGPLTITDLMNLHMGTGWLNYGNWPYRLAYESRKSLRGFYSRNEHNAWDTIQRVHWDQALARTVGVGHIYDIGPMRYTMLCHYLTNFAGDDCWVYYARAEYWNFNYMGDTTRLKGVVVAARVDERLGPMVELEISGVNQRGKENFAGRAIQLVASRLHGPVCLPEPPPVTPHRS
jgi:acyl dehydratase